MFDLGFWRTVSGKVALGGSIVSKIISDDNVPAKIFLDMITANI